ncbi:MAG: F0F1 ATP synthase subunit A, partial [Flavobacteriales bacterium]
MYRKLSLLLLLFSISVFSANAESTETSEELSQNTEKEGYDPVPAIMHHISDAHEWHFWDTEDENGEIHAASIPLPVILYTEKGLVSFMSSEFHHDDAAKIVVERKGQKFVKYHGKIYYASEEAHHGAFLNHTEENGEHLVTNAKPMDFSITKNVAGMFLAMIIILLVFTRVARSYKKNGGVPSGITGWMEPLVIFVRDEIALPNIGEKKHKKFTPLLLSIFFFIWVLNLLGLLPGGANVTGNIAVTLVLAAITMIVVAVNGNKEY